MKKIKTKITNFYNRYLSLISIKTLSFFNRLKFSKNIKIKKEGINRRLSWFKLVSSPLAIIVTRHLPTLVCIDFPGTWNLSTFCREELKTKISLKFSPMVHFPMVHFELDRIYFCAHVLGSGRRLSHRRRPWFGPHNTYSWLLWCPVSVLTILWRPAQPGATTIGAKHFAFFCRTECGFCSYTGSTSWISVSFHFRCRNQKSIDKPWIDNSLKLSK